MSDYQGMAFGYRIVVKNGKAQGVGTNPLALIESFTAIGIGQQP